MDQLKVDIDVENCCIKIFNNGRGLPIEIHKEHDVYVPELVFGHLLTSDNYDDKEKKVTGGRNGYGAKLANIFSTKFVVQTADSSRGLKYKQVFESNMSSKREPKIDKYSGDDFTEVTFYPDLSKFGGMSSLDADIVSLMMKRVYDIAGSIGESTKIYLNNKRLQVKGFKDYCELYLKAFNVDGGVPRVHEKVNGRWEIEISLSDPKEGCGQFQQVSFVNSICTTKGGTHVNHVVDKFLPKLMEKVEAKNKGGMKIQPFHIKNHLWVFVNCLIENPSFDSQTKETLTTKQDQFGSQCAVSDATINKVIKIGVVEQVVSWIKSKQDQNINRLVKNSGSSGNSRILGIPKLEDANDAGTKNGEKCTLILTEGDSAKALAVAGLAVVGRDKFGVFPLRGKLLNVRDATYSQTVENKEVQALMRIVGLDPGKQYVDQSTLKNLRYGSIMLMTDQDHDGSHIKGLLINMIHHWWPSLCKLNGFLKEFVTPIVKVSNGRESREFFTMVEYEQWKRQNDDGRGFKVKYYKGLGTSTAKEARDYFSDIEKHRIAFKWTSDLDGESIDMAFNKKRADDRKEWINAYEDGVCVDHRIKSLEYKDFINKELVQFSKYDVMRSIPSVVDGLKPGQRKVLFCAFKRNLKSDIKVAQFIGYVSEQSAYHHGEQSLESTIVGMAQDFVGSNNVNLLYPSGQFGTRLQGGKDAASGRYIYTRLCNHTRKIFSVHDDALLNYQTEEGQRIEPKWYCPIVPTVLINGADGIGTGWSTSVPAYDARDVIDNLRNLLRGKGLRDMVPAYRGFTGTTEPNGKGGFEFGGKISVLSDTCIEITELPVKTWTQNYKEFLQEMLEDYAKFAEKNAKAVGKKGTKTGGKKTAAAPKKIAKPKKKASRNSSENVTPDESEDERDQRAPQNMSGVQIKDFKEYHTEHFVHFRIELSADNLAKAQSQGLEKVFKLRSTVGTSNMVLFDPNGKIRRYDTALEIIEDFAALRIELYGKRKSYLVSKLEREIEIIQNKVKFVLAVIGGDVKFQNKRASDLVKDLKAMGIKSMHEIESEFKILGTVGEEESNATGEGFDYLLGMSLWSLTKEKVDALTEELAQKRDDLMTLKKTSPEQMWDTDLMELLAALDQRDMEDWKDREAARKKIQLANKVVKNKKKGHYSDDDDDVEMLSDDSVADREIIASTSNVKANMSKYVMAGEIVTVDIKPVEYKPQVWRKEEKQPIKKVEDVVKKELEVMSKALGVESEGGGLLERLLKKKRESEGGKESGQQSSMLNFLSNKQTSKEPKLDLDAIKPPTVSAPKPKKKIVVSDSESVLSDSEDEESVLSSSSSSSSSDVKPKRRSPPTRKKRPAVSDSSSSSSSGGSSESEDSRPARKPRKKASPKRNARKKAKYSSSEDSDDDEDSFVVSDDESDSEYSSD
jgi:DNA topoisomerase-2